MLKPDEDRSFFDRERDKLAGEIATVRIPTRFRWVLPSQYPRPSHMSHSVPPKRTT